MLPNIDHLFWLRHDKQKFEAARQEVITEFLDSLPPERQESARQYQAKVDEARSRLSAQDLQLWMANEARELAENMADQLQAIKNLFDGKSR